MLNSKRGWLGATLATISVVLALPLTIFVVASWLMGWQLMSVQSGSMAPTYPVDSLVVVGPVDPTDVEIGMAIVFEDPDGGGHVITHRVVGRAGEAVAFVTQGDANPAPDPIPVTPRLIRGRVLWHVPELGLMLDWLAFPKAFILLVIVPAVLLAISEVRERRSPRTRPTGGSGLTNRRLADLTPLDPGRSA